MLSVAGSSDNIARLWSVETGEIKREYTGHQKTISAIAFRDVLYQCWWESTLKTLMEFGFYLVSYNRCKITLHWHYSITKVLYDYQHCTLNVLYNHKGYLLYNVISK